MTGELLTRVELSDRLKVSTSTISKWQRIGMPFLKKGYGFVRFDYEEVTQWLRGDYNPPVKEQTEPAIIIRELE